jgi:hypothetical protein
MLRNIRENLEDIETFAIHWHSKALVPGIYRDWIAKGAFDPNGEPQTNRMTTWPGFLLRPSIYDLGNM